MQIHIVIRNDTDYYTDTLQAVFSTAERAAAWIAMSGSPADYSVDSYVVDRLYDVAAGE